MDHSGSSMPAVLSRRAWFSVLPAGAAGCLGCARAMACSQASPPAPSGWTAKADLTWEQIFRFAFQKDLIPVLRELGARLGREEFVKMLEAAGDDVVRKKTAGRPPVIRDLAGFAAGLKNPPPLIRHALEADIVEDSPQAFEYRVTKCLWAKVFREQEAGDLGYAMICHPDYAVARSLHPKLRLIRTRTLMQGGDSCSLRYVMATGPE